ncbi:4-(cytidine 5'-diphospho)-2-C-methyl-D-erythritol kinase [Paraferrimonas haliotis]|uniref:4-diphosphocytidyl-2-C-methyl-D-erythritol kinase n=1 Tax=Paraferrimonas haliotis TaxID=2013866 RepID=A0AA37TWM0_9GAMM|nr:4-(cytidine 5'-diphospho)-2-C-methyl-D-erythritol kinase [Paraferrimonas haliotis]GLS82976.1 4-diphosphocytidyl-2-C-methyl-D-erythritol kinase [Paraferrimonas haliotis]
MTDSSISRNWPAPAKLNLFLHINGRRDDGYHELQTLFQILEFGDSLDFRVRNDSHIHLQTPMANVAEADNLVIRAAKLLQAQGNGQLGADIWLTKRLPMGGGLGGGSSDAATVLVALNALWQTNLSVDELASLGLQLGADVPVFVRGHAAFAEGVGEQLQTVKLDTPWFMVIHPNVEVSTAEIFTHPDLPRNTPKISTTPEEWGLHRNDCQQLVCDLYPQVAKALNWLVKYAPSRMTGTGACLFASFENECDALAAFSNKSEQVTGFVAKSCNRSPLLERLEQFHLSGN